MRKNNKAITKRCFMAILAAGLSASMLTGCGKAEESAPNVEVSEATSEEQEVTNMGNPWVTTDNITVLNETGLYIEAPEGATNVAYSYLTTDKMAQATYTYDNCDWTFRIQKTENLTDISGLNYEWGSVSDGMVSEREAKYYGYSETNDTGMLDGLFGVQLVNWYDKGTESTYSLSVEGTEIGGLDIQVFAEEIFNAHYVGDAGPEDMDIPNNAIEERVGKNKFESYDEIISLLENDEAYAYVKVKGYDGDVLAVTQYTYDDLLGHMATTDCSLYTIKKDGTVSADTILSSGGTATPIAIDKDGVIYTANHVSVEKYCYGENSIGDVVVMCYGLVYAVDRDDNGDPTSVSGFYRTSNSIVSEDNLVDVDESDINYYNQMFDDYFGTEPINFTVIK